VDRNEARRPSHQFYDTDAVWKVAGRLNLGTMNSCLRRLYGTGKAERSIDVVDIIINGFGDASNSDVKTLLLSEEKWKGLRQNLSYQINLFNYWRQMWCSYLSHTAFVNPKCSTVGSITPNNI